MDKVAMYKEYIMEKVASSFDAKRKKQYWQLLKRLYGGSETAIQSIKRTGDDMIHHGTAAKRVRSIEQNGLLVKGGTGKGYNGFGKGVYFGDSTFGPKGLYESSFRLKKPSELKGTKEIYPKVQKAKNHDTKLNPRNMDKETRTSQTYGAAGVSEKHKGKVVFNGYNVDPEHFWDNFDEIGKISDEIYYKNKSNPRTASPVGNNQFVYGLKKIDPKLLVRTK